MAVDTDISLVNQVLHEWMCSPASIGSDEVPVAHQHPIGHSQSIATGTSGAARKIMGGTLTSTGQSVAIT